MGIKIANIDNVSESTKVAIKRKSAQNLPNNPSEKGYSAEEIKRRFYQPILDAANSAIAEIDRVINQVNDRFNELGIGINNYIDSTDIKESYKVEFDANAWQYNSVNKLYECIISAESHEIEDYKDIGVDMFLIDPNGKYIAVNQFEVSFNSDVRFYHDTPTMGYANIYVKREGLVSSGNIVEAKNVTGLAKVALSNDFNDLDNVPDINLSKRNEISIAEIMNGTKVVEKSKQAEFAKVAESVNYASSSGSASTAGKAVADGSGNNIENTYARQNGTYSGMTVGRAIYATSSDSANRATTATSAESATYAITADSANVANTANRASSATYADSATFANSADEANIATTAEQATNSTYLNNQTADYYLNYNNFSNKPTIPTNTNQLENGAGYITSSSITTGTQAWGIKLSNGLILNWGYVNPESSGTTVKLPVEYTNSNYVVSGSNFDVKTNQIRALAVQTYSTDSFICYGQYSEDNSGLTNKDVTFRWFAIGQ